MFPPKNLEAIAQQLHNALPQGLKDVGSDLEEKFKQVLQAQLAKLDIVTREEFDVQSQVLLRTREKLVELEKRVDELLAQKAENSQSQPNSN
ncbi:hypothetical protein A4G20_00160 [Pasteurellaceae bacterium RH1A]|nr:hypothetical protein A4G20_00160 [Pasteurellaceae bacterium RH1A]